MLVGLIVFLGFRTWGTSLLAPFQSPNAVRDIVITKSEFRPDVPGTKPAWIIGLRNNSQRFGYDSIQLEATYLDKSGAVLQRDTMTLHKKLTPGQEEVIGSTDIRDRPGATDGTLKITKADVLK
ncbi:MAG: hypothetical protein ABI600_12805 [Luteolibacter sp.]